MKGSLSAKDNLACTANQPARPSAPNYLSTRDDYRAQIGRQLGNPHHTDLPPSPTRIAQYRSSQLRLFQGDKRASRPPIANLRIFEAMANLRSTPHLREEREEMCPGLQRPGGRLSGFVGWPLRYVPQ